MPDQEEIRLPEIGDEVYYRDYLGNKKKIYSGIVIDFQSNVKLNESGQYICPRKYKIQPLNPESQLGFTINESNDVIYRYSFDLLTEKEVELARKGELA